jgi:hypothetical protein
MWRRGLVKASGMPCRRSMGPCQGYLGCSGVDHIEYTCVAENSNGCETGWIRKEERVGPLRFNGAGEIRQLMRAGGLTQLRHSELPLPRLDGVQPGCHEMNVASGSQFF